MSREKLFEMMSKVNPSFLIIEDENNLSVANNDDRDIIALFATLCDHLVGLGVFNVFDDEYLRKNVNLIEYVNYLLENRISINDLEKIKNIVEINNHIKGNKINTSRISNMSIDKMSRFFIDNVFKLEKRGFDSFSADNAYELFLDVEALYKHNNNEF